MMAGAAWSLVYEWIFYAALPLLALLSARRVPDSALLLSLSISLFLYRRIRPTPPDNAYILRWHYCDHHCSLAQAQSHFAVGVASANPCIITLQKLDTSLSTMES